MALEAAVLSRAAAGLFGRCAMAGAGGGAWNSLFGLAGLDGGDWGEAAAAACSSMQPPHGWFQELDITASTAAMPQGNNQPGGHGQMDAGGVGQADADAVPATPAAAGRRKRRRTRTAKNSEEVESQRMTHIAVERNRRKQMNEYLASPRSLMPPSYSQRGDQASIVAGAINFVKELEQRLQSLESHKQSRQRAANDGEQAPPPPFANFFTFPQYSMSAPAPAPPPPTTDEGASTEAEASSGSKPSTVAEVEVTMVESHASLRMLSRRRPRQLLRLLVALQGHRLTVLHLNMTSAAGSHMVLYSLNLKVEDDCQLTSVDEIATAAHQIVERIQQEQECTTVA